MPLFEVAVLGTTENKTQIVSRKLDVIAKNEREAYGITIARLSIDEETLVDSEILVRPFVQ